MRMPIFEAISAAISDFFKKQGVAEPEIVLEQPVFAVHGDISSNACLRYARELGKNPLEIANELAGYLREQKKIASAVTEIRVVAPGYVNFSFTLDFFAGVVKEIIKSKNFGANKNLAGQKWVVEHTSPNPNKAMHLGHLRNNLVGTSLVNLLEWNGATVKTDVIMNDRGIAIAKMMYGFLISMQKNSETPGVDGVSVEKWIDNPENWHSPESLGVLPDIFVTECYLAGEKAFRESSDTEQKVRDLVVRWESHDKKVWTLWKHVLSFSYAGIERTLARLGNREFDKIWYESEHYEEGKQWVEKGLAAGIFKKLEDGAVVSDLSAYNLADTILLKNDGTSLYITQDLALTALKKKTYKADKLVWVVGPEQALAFKQLFAVCEQLGIGKREDFTHVPYGYVGLKDGEGNFQKMSSREGTVVLIDDVIDAAREKISAIAEDLPAETAEKLALAAVKFSILKSDRNQEISFDVKQSVEINGDSGVYVLYTYARLKSLLRKAGNAAAKSATNSAENIFQNEKAKDIARLVSFFPNIVARSFDIMSAHHVAQSMLAVCGAFNAWYANDTILDGSENQSAKLALVAAVAAVLENGLAILGVETVEEI